MEGRIEVFLSNSEIELINNVIIIINKWENNEILNICSKLVCSVIFFRDAT